MDFRFKAYLKNLYTYIGWFVALILLFYIGCSYQEQHKKLTAATIETVKAKTEAKQTEQKTIAAVLNSSNITKTDSGYRIEVNTHGSPVIPLISSENILLPKTVKYMDSIRERLNAANELVLNNQVVYSQHTSYQSDTIQKLQLKIKELQTAKYVYKDKNLSIAIPNIRDTIYQTETPNFVYNAELTTNFKPYTRKIFGIPTWQHISSTVRPKKTSILDIGINDSRINFAGDSLYRLALSQPKAGGALQATINKASSGAIYTGVGFRGFFKDYNIYLVWYYDVGHGRFLPAPTFSFSRNIINF